MEYPGVRFEKGGKFWTEDIPHKQYKIISSWDMKELGLPKNNIQVVETMEDLKNSPPNIVVAEAVHGTRFIQNWFKQQELYKKHKYVMGLGVYQQLHYDMSRRMKILKPTRPLFRNAYRPYNGEPADNATLLVFRTGGIGDLLFIKPNLNFLKEKYPTCKIRFACGPQYQSMVDGWECVDEVLDLPFPLSALLDADYHLMFEGVIERCREARRTNAYRLFTRWLNINLPDEKLIPKQTPKSDKVDKCKEILKEWNLEEKSFIVMQLRASSPIRTPNPNVWHKIIDELNEKGIKVLLTDNPRQTENVDKFIAESKNPSMVFNFCKHSVSIDLSIAIVSLSMGIIATDSALNHIAASLDLPCFGLYGPFPGEIRLSTYPKADWINAVKECAPCFLHGSTSCPKAGSDYFSPCYNNINTSEVVERAMRLFKL